MPELNLQDISFVVCVAAFTLTAAVWDFRTRKIPNRLTIPVFVLGLLYQIVFNGWSGHADMGIAGAGLKSALSAFAVGFGTLFVLWMVGGGGGGDVKMMGALSVWLGLTPTLLVMVASTVFVLVGTLAVMFWSLVTRGPSETKTKYLATGKTNKEQALTVSETIADRRNRRVMAYALPVALATWLVMIWKLPVL